MTISGHRKVGYWVHSGGVDPVTGRASLASQLRIYALLTLLKAECSEGDKPLVFLSGEATRKSGGYDQATVIAAFAREGFGTLKPDVQVLNVSVTQAFTDIGHYHRDLDELVFIMDDVHMSRQRWQFAKANPLLAAKIRYVDVPVTLHAEYVETYPLDYMAAYNAAAWLRDTVKAVGALQFLLFLVDRAVNKPTGNPVKKAIAKVVGTLLRKDLR